MRTDTERLDWLERQRNDIEPLADGWGVNDLVRGPISCGATLREAIDAAMDETHCG
jgi:hypothetical protein